MKLEIANTDLFISILNCLKPIIGSCESITINLSPDFLSVKMWEPTHTAICDCKLGKEFFEIYEAIDNQLIFDVDKFFKYIKSFKKFKRLLITDKGTGIQLSSEKSKSRKRMVVPTIVLEEIEEEVPDIQLDWTFVSNMPSKWLTEGIKDAALVSDDAVLEKIGEIFKITAKDDQTTTTREWNISDDMIALIAKDAKSIFSTKILELMVAAGEKISERVQISLGNNLPLELKYVFDGGYLTYYLAPLVGGD